MNIIHPKMAVIVSISSNTPTTCNLNLPLLASSE